jgi:heptosyltransferase-2
MTNILIVKFGALGDVIRTSYILPGLHKKYAKPNIAWLTSPASFELIRFNPYIAEVASPEFRFSTIKQAHYDLVISLDDEKDILKLLADFRYRDFIGAYLRNDIAVYTDSASAWFDMGLISRFGKAKADALKKENKREHNQILAAMLDIRIDDPVFFNSPVIEKKVASLFDKEFFNVGINSGAGARWFSKQLPVEETTKLIAGILSHTISGKKTCVCLLGGREEMERHAIIKSAVKSNRLFDAGNDNSLLEFAAIVGCCDYVISSDSLALHLAISQKVKNLSFYAPTSADEIGTFGFGVKLISHAPDYCSYRKDADNSSITAERVLLLMKSHLNGGMSE